MDEGDGTVVTYQRVDSLAWSREEKEHGKNLHVKDFPKGHRLQLFRLVVSKDCNMPRASMSRSWLSARFKSQWTEVGHAEQNGYAERVIRTIKEEEVYLNEYRDYEDALNQIG